MKSGCTPKDRSSFTECWVGLVFSLHLVGRGDIRHERHVDEQHVARAGLLLELACRLDEGQPLDVADGAADFRDDDVGAGLLGRAADPLLDGLGHVRDDLHGATEEIAAPLAGDERLIDGALGEVALAREVLVDEALVVAEIQIALMAVLGDEHLAVLEGASWCPGLRSGTGASSAWSLCSRAPSKAGPAKRR